MGSRSKRAATAREIQIDRNGRQSLPAVSIRTRADDRAVELAAKLASAAAEALELDGVPAQRLATVLVEGARNAVEHAYAGLPTGDIEVALISHRPEPGAGADELNVTIRDFGAGCPLGPTTAEPPGLGLSIISELSDAIQINSQRHAGTVIDATIRIGGGGAGRSQPAASRGSRLMVGDPAFLGPVIPRAIAVHAAAASGSVDAVRAAIEGGSDIAAAIGPAALAGGAPILTISCPRGSGTLEVLVDPNVLDPGEEAEGLGERLRSQLHSAPVIGVEEHGGTGGVWVSFSLL